LTASVRDAPALLPSSHASGISAALGNDRLATLASDQFLEIIC